MARIRSIHPGQWFDEDFVALSFQGRILALALRNIADDRGIFEWKPLTIKMQLLPADGVDVADILSELVANNIVMEFEVEGKQYGAIRNFMKWQRPKKPSYQHPCPEPVLNYVGVRESQSGNASASSAASSEPVPHQEGSGSEFAPQRKEEGGRRKDVGGKRKKEDDAADAASTSSSKYVFEAKNIRLIERHFEDWRKAYPSLRLEAELFALDEWAGTKGKAWFNAVASALKNKQIEADERAAARQERMKFEAMRPPTRQHIDGRI